MAQRVGKPRASRSSPEAEAEATVPPAEVRRCCSAYEPSRERAVGARRPPLALQVEDHCELFDADADADADAGVVGAERPADGEAAQRSEGDVESPATELLVQVFILCAACWMAGETETLGFEQEGIRRNEMENFLRECSDLAASAILLVWVCSSIRRMLYVQYSTGRSRRRSLE